MATLRETRCERSDLYPSQCAHCRGDTLDVTVSDTDLVLVTRWHVQQSGDCPNCDRRLAEGDWLAKTGDGDVLCERCLP